MKKLITPSPALVVSIIALFIALGGTAGAVVTQAVPLARRALVADNAKRLGGQTPAQLTIRAATAAANRPGPASTAAGTLSVISGTTTLAPDAEGEFSISCQPGQKVAGGGFSSDGSVVSFDSYPATDAQWRVYLSNLGTAAANVRLFATCVR